MTTFVDRERETALALEVLGRSRVLTIVGDEGSGKSRLAAEVARIEAGRDRERAPVVDLAPIGSDALVASAIARRLDVVQARPRVIDALAERLRDDDLLIVLDNGETVRHGCASSVERLLSACPRLRFLVTARDPLRVLGESVIHVAGLPVPPEGTPSRDEVARSPAVRLFVDRVAAARPGFDLANGDAPLVADLCRRLDGIPLALELAASRARTQPLEEVAAGVAERLPSVRGAETRGADIVQAAIAWALDTLPRDELVVLRRVSVLADFDYDAATAVSRDLDASTVIAALEQLRLDGLVTFDPATSRFSMLEVIRDRARGMLDRAGELAATQSAAVAYFAELVEAAHPHLFAPDQRDWLDRLEREHDNIRGCVQLLLSERSDPRGARLAALLWRYWYIRGHLLEGRLWLRLAVSLLDGGAGATKPDADELRALCLHGAGTLAWAQGDYEGARMALDESVALRRRLGDNDQLSDSLNNRGTVAVYEGEYPLAMSLLEESRVLAETTGSTHGIARALTNLGYVARLRGDVESAAELLGQAYRVLSDEGDTRSLTIVLSNIGAVRLAQGDLAGARQALEEGLVHARELTAKESTSILLAGLSTVALVEGRREEARRLAEESLAIAEGLGQRRIRADALWRCALVDIAERQWAHARQLVDDALTLTDDPHLRASCLATRARVAMGQGRTPAAREDAEASLRLRVRLGDELGEIESLTVLVDLVGRDEAAAFRRSLGG